jgi:hypothetical protein
MSVGGLILICFVAGTTSFLVAGFLYFWLKSKSKSKSRLLRFLFYVLSVVVGFIVGLIAGAIVVSLARGLPENIFAVMVTVTFLCALPCVLLESIKKF